MKKEDFVVAAAVLEDRHDLRSAKYELEWNGFWHFHNVMQFMENFIAVSETGLQNKTYLALPLPALEDVEIPVEAGSSADGWQGILDFLRESANADEMTFVNSLRDKNIAVPDVVGDEIMENGQVIDVVELAWQTSKIAFVLSDCKEAKENLTKAGWTVFDEKEENIEKLFGGVEHG